MNLVRAVQNSTRLQNLAKGMTIVTFVILCWVFHRATRSRPDCIDSSFIGAVQFEGRRAYNCAMESRLDLSSLTDPLSLEFQRILTTLEAANSLTDLWPARADTLIVDILSPGESEGVTIESGRLKLPKPWLEHRRELRRALIMTMIKSQGALGSHDDFALEVMADFIVSLVYGDEAPKLHLPSTPVRFSDYCRSAFLSLLDAKECQTANRDFMAIQELAGVRPLVSQILLKVFHRASLRDQMRAMQALTSKADFPVTLTPVRSGVMEVSQWIGELVRQYLLTLELLKRPENEFALRSTLREFEVEGPTRWELTVDITRTPAWREIVRQLEVRSQFRPKERILIFTPDGAIALPAKTPVHWAANEIRSQKHVMIACDEPLVDELRIRARHVYSQQTCARLDRPFWD
ncbi:MAG: hypothetical protein AB7F86_07985 [Bdellovibrionales bacterium]